MSSLVLGELARHFIELDAFAQLAQGLFFLGVFLALSDVDISEDYSLILLREERNMTQKVLQGIKDGQRSGMGHTGQKRESRETWIKNEVMMNTTLE